MNQAFFAWGPGLGIPGNSVTHALGDITDIFPTFAALARFREAIANMPARDGRIFYQGGVYAIPSVPVADPVNPSLAGKVSADRFGASAPGIEAIEPAWPGDIQVRPLPNGLSVTFASRPGSNLEVAVHDLRDKTLRQTRIPGTGAVRQTHVLELPPDPGIYYLKMRANGVIRTQKVVVPWTKE